MTINTEFQARLDELAEKANAGTLSPEEAPDKAISVEIGFEKGDAISVDGKRISSVEQLRDAIAAHEPGDKVKLVIYRGADKSSVTVTLGRQPPSPQG